MTDILSSHSNGMTQEGAKFIIAQTQGGSASGSSGSASASTGGSASGTAGGSASGSTAGESSGSTGGTSSLGGSGLSSWKDLFSGKSGSGSSLFGSK